MRNRSRIHMLTVAASRLESDHANPKLVADLRIAAVDAANKKVEGLGWTQADVQRVERQRTLYAMLPSSSATDRFKECVLQRAYDLMWEGELGSVDALAEFMPSKDVDRMFEAWQHDQEGKQPPSSFYQPKD